MFATWVIDVTLETGNMFCFVPIENLGTEQETVVWGMNLITSLEGFNQGKIVGVIHADGQDAVEAWCRAHPVEYLAIVERAKGD